MPSHSWSFSDLGAAETTFQVKNQTNARGQVEGARTASITSTGAKDTLHLPPEDSPFVAVLTGVPHLKDGQEENFLSLRNKVCHWLIKFKGLTSYHFHKIIMARRLNWIGCLLKYCEGDCVVVNFNDRGLVRFLLQSSTNMTEAQRLPLDHSYSPHTVHS